ncbi:MAG: SRPBCC family protein [Candidatus Eiseniibacteriota bacterium]
MSTLVTFGLDGRAGGVRAAGAATALGQSERMLHAELTVDAPVKEVWNAWTTAEGIATFFAPAGHVDLRVDGTYDVWFFPKAEPGLRGAEGMRILDVDPMRRFVFTWNAPPTFPTVRDRRTVVVLELEELAPARTRFRFTQMGWGEGADWDKVYAYFDRAWGAVVLPRMVHRFANGPIDWDSPPELEPVAPTLQQTLAEWRP